MNTEILEEILPSTTKYQGLSSQEYEIALDKYGPNLRPAQKKPGALKRLIGILSEPMILLLLVAALAYVVLGDYIDTVILLISIIPILIIEFIQERRTDKAIEALDKIVVDFCRVYRDGKIIKTEIKNLVPGDLVYLGAGDKTPADGVLVDSSGLLVDESMLTGESVVVGKASAEDIKNITDENKLFQGTLIAQGEGCLLVTDTGASTAYGKLGNLLEKIERLDTPLQKSIRKLVRGVAIIAIAVSFVAGILIALQSTWINGLLGATTLAMSLIPEEFPIVFSVFLIMGVWRMTKQKALIREMAMVETLGSATIICTDKTGTLTEGKMSIEEIYYENKHHTKKDFENITEILKTLMKTVLLSLEQVAADPIEIEAQKFAANLGIDVNKHFSEQTLLEDQTFESKSKMLHHLFRDSEKNSTQYSAGAPESVVALCKLSQEEKNNIQKKYEEMAAQGYRVIAVAKKNLRSKEKLEKFDLDFVALLAMSDPPRANIKEAIEICQKAGIRVIMITGDNHLTALNIAKSIGLIHSTDTIKGDDLENISDERFAEIVREHDIFTRVKPEQKFQIVEALQKQGEIVAMTGDGVNDAPALKKANIGIAMGEKGTEVARAAAGIVLLDDNFGTIVTAVKEGRRIYDNIRQAFIFLFSFHIPIVGMALLPLILGEPLVFFPINVVFLELFCDPASVIGFERDRARRGLMLEKPRPTSEPLISTRQLRKVMIQGLAIFAVCAIFYCYYALYIHNLDMARTFTFISLTVSQVTLIMITREWDQVKHNYLLIAIWIITITSLILIMSLPPLREIFHLVKINLNQFITLITVSISAMILTGLVTRKLK